MASICCASTAAFAVIPIRSVLQVCIATESFIRDVHDEKRELSLAIVRHGQWNGSIPAERPELHSVVELWQRLLENFIPEIDVDHEVDHLKG